MRITVTNEKSTNHNSCGSTQSTKLTKIIMGLNATLETSEMMTRHTETAANENYSNKLRKVQIAIHVAEHKQQS
ncbi:hypothetical protein CISIN_1g046798mg [Citrus sinensis]|uniref:Uncharacterized protein n=1 Tax=Citrus sinensis TaxID=2711 RepID=A0A067GN07_CITSI|nr:hypothetical protein CISIN_1g046798mg [Citrus sinensis]